MKQFGLFIFFILIPHFCFANNLHFVYPGGEGDAKSAQPFLEEFYTYLQDQTGQEWTGEYVNDPSDAKKLLKKSKSGFAIVSPEFKSQYKQSFQFKTVLKTVPQYATGAYEKFYILSHKDTDILTLINEPVRVNLFTSQPMQTSFLNEKIFFENEQIKTIPWNLQQTGNILGAIQKIASGVSGTFVLLTGYEFQMIQKLKANKKELQNLKLVYTSPELETAQLVSFGESNTPNSQALKTALLKMDQSLKGNLILKNLRLKKFSP